MRTVEIKKLESKQVEKPSTINSLFSSHPLVILLAVLISFTSYGSEKKPSEYFLKPHFWCLNKVVERLNCSRMGAGSVLYRFGGAYRPLYATPKAYTQMKLVEEFPKCLRKQYGLGYPMVVNPEAKELIGSIIRGDNEEVKKYFYSDKKKAFSLEENRDFERLLAPLAVMLDNMELAKFFLEETQLTVSLGGKTDRCEKSAFTNYMADDELHLANTGKKYEVNTPNLYNIAIANDSMAMLSMLLRHGQGIEGNKQHNPHPIYMAIDSRSMAMVKLVEMHELAEIAKAEMRLGTGEGFSVDPQDYVNMLLENQGSDMLLSSYELKRLYLLMEKGRTEEAAKIKAAYYFPILKRKEIKRLENIKRSLQRRTI